MSRSYSSDMHWGDGCRSRAAEEREENHVKLSIELFKQITAGLRADKAAERGKRREPRVGLAAEASVVSGVTEDACRTSRIQVRDISSTGLGLIVPNKMAAKQKFVIELNSDDGQFWLLCESVYCHRVEDRMFKVGAKHTKVLNPEEVKKIAARMLLAPNASEKEVGRIRVAILN